MSEKIYHYRHEKSVGTLDVHRNDAKSVSVSFPDELSGEYRIPLDEREQRALVVFDGDLLFGALPKKATVVRSISLSQISCPSRSMRKTPVFLYDAVPSYEKNGTRMQIHISRYFILLPVCTAVVRKYRDKSLSPIYVIIRVCVNNHGTRVVEWQTSSY